MNLLTEQKQTLKQICTVIKGKAEGRDKLV